MADRRVKVVLEAEVAGYKRAMEDAAKSTETLAKKTEEVGKSSDDRAKKIALVAAADQKAAKAAGLAYNAAGQLVDSNNKVMSSSQAAAHGVQAFSEAVYLAGYESEQAAAKQAAAAEEAAAAQKAAAEEAAAAVQKQQDAWAEIGPTIAVAGAATVAAVGKAVATYASFDKAMSSVQASTHASAAEMAAYREAAVEAGADTAYSAQEAAGAIDELAKAGVSSTDILGGGLDGALSLAAAGSLEVATAAEIAASAMTQFKLKGDQLPHVADLLAAGAGKAQGSVEDMGAALNQSGLVAAQTGLTIEETTAGLSAFASAGLIGSDAGTSFKTMLQSLTPNSKAAAELMDELGISAYDSQGNFIGLAEYAGQLQGALSSMSAEQRNATMKTLFGSDAVRAAAVLYEQGADGVRKWEEAVSDAGYAAETAAALQDNLAGDLEKLSGSIDTVFLQSGSGANDVLRGMVQGIEGVVDVVGQIPTPVLSVGTMLAGVAGGAALLGGGLITVLPKVRDTRDALRDLAPAGTRADRALRGVGKAAAIAGTAVGTLAIVGPTIASWVSSGNAADPSKLADGLFQVGAGGDAAQSGMAGLDAMFTSGFDWFSGLEMGGLEDAFRVMGNPNISDNVDNTLSSILSFGTRGSSNVEFAKKNFQALDEQLANMVANGAADQASASYEALTQKAAAAGVPVEKLVEIFPGYNSALADSSVASQSAAAGGDEVAGALEEVGVSADGAITKMEDFLDTLFRSGMLTMDSRDAAFAYEEQLRSITKAQEEIAKGEMGATLNKTKDDFNETTEAGKLANDEFQALARDGMAEVESLAKEGVGQDELQGKLSQTYNDLVTAGKGFGLSGEAAKDLARKVLGVPDGVSIKSWMSDAARQEAEKTKAAVESVDGLMATITQRKVTIFETKGSAPPTAPRTGGSPGAWATGGPVFGPGSGTSDDVPAMLSNGEHVLTAEEVGKMGGHGAVERMRALAKAGLLPAFAKGGRVGWARDQQADAKKDWEAAKRELARAKKSKDDKRIKRAEKALDAAKSEYDDAKQRTAELRESTSELKTDLRRGTIRDAFTSGSGMSVVDRMFDAAADPNLSDKQRSKMLAQARSTEKQLLALEKRSERVKAKLEDATAARDELLAVRDAVKGSMVGTFDLTSLTGQKDAWGYDKKVTKGSLLAYGRTKAVSAKKLSEKVGMLQLKGFAPELIQMVVDEWVSAGTFEVADAMLSMSKAESIALNSSFASVEKYATKTGDYLTNAMAEGGLNAAQTLVDTLTREEKAVEKAFYNLGKSGEKGFKRAWGINSPSRVAKELIGWVVKGGVDEMKAQEPTMSKAAAELMAVPATVSLSAPALSPAYTATATAAQGIDYDRLALAMANVQITSPVNVDRRTAARLVQVGQQFQTTHG